MTTFQDPVDRRAGWRSRREHLLRTASGSRRGQLLAALLVGAVVGGGLVSAVGGDQDDHHFGGPAGMRMEHPAGQHFGPRH